MPIAHRRTDRETNARPIEIAALMKAGKGFKNFVALTIIKADAIIRNRNFVSAVHLAGCDFHNGRTFSMPVLQTIADCPSSEHLAQLAA